MKDALILTCHETKAILTECTKKLRWHESILVLYELFCSHTNKLSDEIRNNSRNSLFTSGCRAKNVQNVILSNF